MQTGVLSLLQVIVTGCCIGFVAPGFGKAYDATELYKSFAEEPPTPLEQINGFRVQRLSEQQKLVTLTQASAVVRLLTPLNSGFQMAGDTVQAELVSSDNGRGKAWLPKGTVLSGCVEQSSGGTYARTDGLLYLRFYSANAAGNRFDVNTLPASPDTAIHPLEQVATTKQNVRKALMAVSFVAIPMAMGTGGVTLAITAGAGALIGGALADKGQHVRGAIDGAWEGSGLGMLDPVVRKGRSVLLPEGTCLALKLTEPTSVPAEIIALAQKQAMHKDDLAITLGAHAALVSHNTIETAEIMTKCDKLLEQKNLAAALSLLDSALVSAPSDERLTQMRKQILEQVGDFSSSQPTASDNNRGTE